MALITVLDNDFGIVKVDPDKRLVYHTIKKWVSGENLKTILNTGCDQMVKYKCTRWLSDDRLNSSALTEQDETWAKTNWFPRTLKAGWKSWAIVLPSKIVGQMNMKRFSDEYNKAGIKACAFPDLEPAMKWIETQD